MQSRLLLHRQQTAVMADAVDVVDTEVEVEAAVTEAVVEVAEAAVVTSVRAIGPVQVATPTISPRRQLALSAEHPNRPAAVEVVAVVTIGGGINFSKQQTLSCAHSMINLERGVEFYKKK